MEKGLKKQIARKFGARMLSLPEGEAALYCRARLPEASPELSWVRAPGAPARGKDEL